MRVVLILNPTSGESPISTTQETAGEHEEAILAGLHTYGIEPEVRYTTPEEVGRGLAKQPAAEHAEMVIAAGGDGTIHEVAKGLIGTQSTLGIIPIGTMNNLALSLNIPETIEAACAIIAKGETRTIDVGEMNGHTFMEVAGIGLEAALFPLAEEIKRPGLLSAVRAFIEGLNILLTYKPTKFTITFDEAKPRSYEALQVTVCNAPYYGAHLSVASHILMDDGLLDVIIYKNFSKLEYIRHAISISQGRREFQPKITHRRVKSMRINADHPVEIQADGLPHGHTPAMIAIVPGALRVRVPGIAAPGIHNGESPVEKDMELQM